MRLQRFLAQSGVAARRKAEQLIVDGAVKVNGKIVDILGSKVDPERDRVSVNGQAVHPEDLFYVVLNKPKGCITTVSDPEGRRTVMEYVRNVPVNIVPVGRLDYYSEGVLLMTNDGELSAALQSPNNHIEKTYHVKLRGKVLPKHLQSMRAGVRLEDGSRTRPAQVEQLRGKSVHEWLALTLTEGKSRQIRRMAEALGYQVLKLQRVAFADITFHGLRLGDARELSQAEVNGLRKAVELATGGRAISRGKWRVKREDTEYSRRAHERARQEEADPDRPSSSGPRSASGGNEAPSRGKSAPKRARPSRGGTKAAPRRGRRDDGPPTRETKAAPKRGRRDDGPPSRGATKAAPKRGRRDDGPPSRGTKAAPKRGRRDDGPPSRGATKAAPKRGRRDDGPPSRGTKAAPKRGRRDDGPPTRGTKAAPKRGRRDDGPPSRGTKAAPKRGRRDDGPPSRGTKAAPKRGTKTAPKRGGGAPGKSPRKTGPRPPKRTRR